MNNELRLDNAALEEQDGAIKIVEKQKIEAQNEQMALNQQLELNQQLLEKEQTRLSQEGQIEQYRNQENQRLQVIQQGQLQQKKESENSTPKEKDIPWLQFWLMLLFAILCDILCFFINLVPLVGGLLEDIILTVPILFIFFIWAKISGISLLKGVRAIITPIIAIVGFIPILNAFPKWTLEVVLLIGVTVAEKMIRKVVKKAPTGVKNGVKNKISGAVGAVPYNSQRQLIGRIPPINTSSSRAMSGVSRSASRPIPNTIKSPSRPVTSETSGLIIKK